MRYKLIGHSDGNYSIASDNIEITHGNDDKPVIHFIESNSEFADKIKITKTKKEVIIDDGDKKIKFKR